MAKKILMPSVYQPEFGVSEQVAPELGDVKIGEKMKTIINYRVVEKTKSYTILKIDYVHLTKSRRTF